MKLKILCGTVLLAAWIVSRFSLTTTRLVGVALLRTVTYDETYYLIASAVIIAVSNAIKAVFLYCGWFLVGEGMAGITRKSQLELFIPLVMIPLSYQATVYFQLPIVPLFGFSAFFTLLSVLFLQFICRDVSHNGYKIVIQMMIVFAIQWLDVIPSLSRYGFGRGEHSTAVKTVAALMERSHMLGVICGVVFFVSSAMALLVARLFVSYEKQLKQLNLIRVRERDLVRLRHQQASARLYQEMQHLVHDLKRPLTVIIGLANLLSESVDKTSATHGAVILKSSEQMEQMINEIKAPDAVRSVSVAELLDFTMAQVRPLPWGDGVLAEIDGHAAGMVLSVNQIRFSRALVNLLDNAYNATRDLEEPLIRISAAAAEGGVIINIEDNGPGFLTPRDDRLSSWGSTGLGLAFTRQVVTDGGGRLSFEDMRTGGLRCAVWMPAAAMEVR